MSQTNNVHAEIAKRSERLADKLGANPDLANVILGFLGRLIIMCSQMNRPIEGIILSPLDSKTELNGDVVFTSNINFSLLAVRPPSLWQPQTDFAEFAAARAQGLAMALGKNPNLSEFFQSLASQIESYGNAKGIPFNDLRIKNPFISKDHVLVIRVGKEL